MPGILPYPPFRKRRRDAPQTIADIGSGEGAGIAALSHDLTINSQTVSPTFRYEARHATTGVWTATVGENLTGQGSGGLVGLDTPLPGTIDEAVNGDGTRNWGAGNTVFADVGTEDLIKEVVFRTPDTTALRAICGKWNTLNGYIWLVSSASLRVQLRSGGSAINVFNYSIAPSSWYHAMFFGRRASQAILYLNTVAGTAFNISSLGSLASNTEHFLIGLDGTGNYPSDSPIAYCAMWKKTGLLDTHEQPDLVKERFAHLTGVYSDRLSAIPDFSLLRSSIATLEKQSQGGAQKLFSVGVYWPRIVRRNDIYNRYASGYQSESQHTNLLPYSQDFDNAGWTKTRATVTPNTTEAPSGEVAADTIAEDGTAASTHYVLETIGGLVIGTPCTVYCLAKAINRQWVYWFVQGAVTGTIGQYFDIGSGALGGALGTAPDASDIVYVGDGWYRCSMTLTPTIGTTGNIGLGVADGDGGNVFDGLSQDSVYAWGAQVTATKYPVSPIRTSGAAATRLADGPLQYTGLSLPSKYTLAVDMLTDESPAGVDRCLAELSDGTSSNIARIYRDAATSRVNAFIPSNADVATPSDYIAGQWHEVRGTFETNNVNSYIDGSAGTADTLVTVPTGLDELNIGAQFDSASPADALVRLRLFSSPTEKNFTDFGDIMAKASGYISTPAGVSASTSYVNVGGTFTSVNLSDFTLSAAGVFTYTGADTKRFYVAGACSGAKSGGGTAQVVTTIEKNGVAVTSSESSRDVTGTAVGAWAVFADVELANGDTVNFAIKISAGTETITMDKLSAVVIEAGN